MVLRLTVLVKLYHRYVHLTTINMPKCHTYLIYFLPNLVFPVCTAGLRVCYQFIFCYQFFFFFLHSTQLSVAMRLIYNTKEYDATLRKDEVTLFATM